ncbi:MAG: acyloxyacyl hydrolase [Kiloniellales bacterium]
MHRHLAKALAAWVSATSLAAAITAGATLTGGILVGSSGARAQDPLMNDDPGFISLGIGGYDVYQNDDTAVDFRLEYRHGKRLWIFKPWAGIEATSDGAVYGLGGILVDLFFGRRIVVTPSFGAGAYFNGDGKDLGGTIEFRSQLEIAYRFNDRSRLGIALSHISNAGLGDDNPGTEIVTLYYSIPFHKVFPPDY